MSDNMKIFVYIRYFWALLCPCFTSIKSVEESIKKGIKDTKNVESTKFGQISKKTYVSSISWYSRLFYISSEVSSISLSRFLSVSIIR